MSAIQRARIKENKRRLTAILEATEKIRSDFMQKEAEKLQVNGDTDSRLIDSLEQRSATSIPGSSLKRPLPASERRVCDEPTWKSSKLTFTLKKGNYCVAEEEEQEAPGNVFAPKKEKVSKKELEKTSLEDLLKAITGESKAAMHSDEINVLDELSESCRQQADIIIGIDGIIKYT